MERWEFRSTHECGIIGEGSNELEAAQDAAESMLWNLSSPDQQPDYKCPVRRSALAEIRGEGGLQRRRVVHVSARFPDGRLRVKWFYRGRLIGTARAYAGARNG